MKYSAIICLSLLLLFSVFSCQDKPSTQTNPELPETSDTISDTIEVSENPIPQERKAIEAVRTSTALFVGYTEKAIQEEKNCTNKAVLITSFGEYERMYGQASEGYYTWESVKLFFENGGKRCFIISVSNTETTLQKGSLLRGLEISREVDAQLVLVPDAVGLSPDDFYEVQNRMTALCSELGDRMAILNTLAPTSNHELDFENFRSETRAEDLSYATVYYPWLVTASGTQVPPAGAMAGVYAATDVERGVWQAPANRSVNGITDLTQELTDREQSSANIDPTAGKSINLIRKFTGKGILVWGARTLDGNSNDWRYINVRRTVIMLESSVDQGLAWASFEPNDAELWTKVKDDIHNFLATLHRDGAFQGATADEAYSVLCGLRETMTDEDILNGLLRFNILVAPVRPAEFIVINKEIQMKE